MLTIDPNCLIWPTDIMDSDESISQIGDFIIQTLEIIGESNEEIYLPRGLEDELYVQYNSPCGDLFAENYPHHQDITSVFLNVYINLPIEYFDVDLNTDLTSDPTFKHAGSTYSMNVIIDSFITWLFSNNLFSVVSYNEFVGGRNDVTITHSTNPDNISVEGFIASRPDEIQSLCFSHNRLFEPNIKHDKDKHHKKNKDKDVSILKSNESDCLKLLRSAKPISNNSTDKHLYNYDEKINEYIIFLEHEHNKWHGYNPEKVGDNIKKLLNK